MIPRVNNTTVSDDEFEDLFEFLQEFSSLSEVIAFASENENLDLPQE